MTDAWQHKRIVFLDLLHRDAWDARREATVQLFDESVGDDRITGVGRMHELESARGDPAG